MSVNYLEVGVDAAFVAVGEELEGFLGGGGGLGLLLILVVEDAEGGEIVFDFLEGGESGLAIGGYGAVVICEGGFGICLLYTSPSPRD